MGRGGRGSGLGEGVRGGTLLRAGGVAETPEVSVDARGPHASWLETKLDLVVEKRRRTDCRRMVMPRMAGPGAGRHRWNAP